MTASERGTYKRRGRVFFRLIGCILFVILGLKACCMARTLPRPVFPTIAQFRMENWRLDPTHDENVSLWYM
jgi:hypothetical protein